MGRGALKQISCIHKPISTYLINVAAQLDHWCNYRSDCQLCLVFRAGVSLNQKAFVSQLRCAQHVQ